jgi:hypothetical protein
MALQLVARYDALRLQTYRDCESLGDKIGIGGIGPAIALRFDDVGYFNRAYADDGAVWGSIGEIESFYRGCRWGCCLVGPPSPARSAAPRPGWDVGPRYAWLHGRSAKAVGVPGASEFLIRPPAADEKALFLRCYLQAFGASPSVFSAALRNMRHLFDRPELDFLIAWWKNRPAGIGMLYRAGTAALLCAGATLPGMRGCGCHQALIAARLRLARDRGCQEIFSWANAGGQSQANLERAGLKTVGVTHAWRLDADRIS